jgi:hypothetical protein
MPVRISASVVLATDDGEHVLAFRSFPTHPHLVDPAVRERSQIFTLFNLGLQGRGRPYDMRFPRRETMPMSIRSPAMNKGPIVIGIEHLGSIIAIRVPGGYRSRVQRHAGDRCPGSGLRFLN